MGDRGRLAGREALDEMGRVVSEMLAAIGDGPPAEEPTTARRAELAERTPGLPDLAGVDALLTGAEAGWAEWRRRLGALTSPPGPLSEAERGSKEAGAPG